MADEPTQSQPTTVDGPQQVIANETAGNAASTTPVVTGATKDSLKDVDGPASLAAAFDRPLSLSSRAIHADDYINNHKAVAPPMHVSTTYRYDDDPDKLSSWNNLDPNAPYDSHIYSRDSAPNSTRLEAVLSSLLGAPSLTYSSGLSAFYAMLVLLNPRRVAIGGGYHGCHGVLALLGKLTGLRQIDVEPERQTAAELEAALTGPDGLQRGDVLHVETPVNPTGEARDLAWFRRVADRTGAWLTVDATFGPPPLQDPFAEGLDADVVMHSGTKYFGGHSDMLCGVLAVNPRWCGPRAGRAGEEGLRGLDWIEELRQERLVLGSVMGSLEGWLGVRSLRTLELRVERQSSNAQKLVEWLASEMEGNKGGAVAGLVERVQHASLQREALTGGNAWLRKQMPRGFGPVFAVWMKDDDDARRLPSKMHLFHHATSLGGVESLIEWRAMSDRSVSKKLLRVSVGVEGWEDLRDDLARGFAELAKERKQG